MPWTVSALNVTPNPISMTIITASSSAERARFPCAPDRARHRPTVENACSCSAWRSRSRISCEWSRKSTKAGQGRGGKAGAAVSVPRCPSGQCVGTRRPATRQHWRHVPLCRRRAAGGRPHSILSGSMASRCDVARRLPLTCARGHRDDVDSRDARRCGALRAYRWLPKKLVKAVVPNPVVAHVPTPSLSATVVR